jgi:DNA replication protein DnaC
MMIHPVLDSLKQLRLKGFVEALENQLKHPASKQLLFEERLALLTDHEIAFRENKRLQERLKRAKFKQQAYLQDVIYEPSRKLDRSLIMSLENCDWITKHRNILITGATGTGKSYIAEAIAHNACLKGFTVLRVQCPRIFQELTAAKADGSYLKMQAGMGKADLLLIDDLGISPLTDENRRDFLGFIDDRCKNRPTIITSQLPVKNWHEAIGDATLADAILDRLIHDAYRIPLAGESMRKKLSTMSEKEKNGS